MAAKIQRVEVTRPFRHRGEEIGAGSVLDLDTGLAKELRTAKKVVFVALETKPVVVPLKKKERPALQPSPEIAALAAQVATLTALVEKLSKGKEKASA